MLTKSEERNERQREPEERNVEFDLQIVDQRARTEVDEYPPPPPPDSPLILGQSRLLPQISFFFSFFLAKLATFILENFKSKYIYNRKSW